MTTIIVIKNRIISIVAKIVSYKNNNNNDNNNNNNNNYNTKIIIIKINILIKLTV